ncbi:MAG: Amino acid transporter binding protein and permease protein, partial [Deltaproteobacteria bacterium]|nr:Amino acid transporter binding protein and permease protein [Deltaproteobacteria bacterium]
MAALAVVTAVALSGCAGGGDAPGQTLAGIQERGEITWGADRNGGEPYVYDDPADSSRVIGFEVDLMDAIARRLGVKARMVQYTWSNLVPSLERGDFDVVMNGLEATPERRERILLSDPYFIYAETLTIRDGDPYRAIFDLRGKRVGTLNQTYAHDILNMLPVEPVLYEGNQEPYDDLELGRTEAVLLDNVIADRYGCIPSRPKLRCIPYDIARGSYAIGMRKGDHALEQAINQALAAMRADGELERILSKEKLWDARQTEARSAVGAATQARTFDWDMLGQFASAAVVTLELSVLAFLLAMPLGLLLAITRVYGAAPMRAAARVYIELFRGTPVLLQLYVIYYGVADYVKLGPIEAAVLGLGLNYAAYEAEVYRGALLAIPRGQSEA